MGIQPIDLQTMYSQLSNVSKVMSGSQQAQLTEAMQQQSNIQKNIEASERVQQTSNENAKSTLVNQDGSNSSAFMQQNKKKNQNQNSSDEQNKHISAEERNPYIGTIIDITR